MSDNVADDIAYKSAFHYSAVGMAFMNLDGAFFRANDAFGTILGYSKDELCKMHFKQVTHPDDLEECLDCINILISGKQERCQFEKRCNHKDGHIVWSLVSLSLVRKNNNDPDYFIAQIQDISKRVNAEEKLQESEKFFELALEAARDGIWDWPDTRKDDAYWSSQWNKLVGYKDGELEQKVSVFISLLHPDDVEKTQKSLYNASQGKGRYDVEIRLKTKSGEYKWFQAKGIASPGKESGTTRMTGSLTDIDERKKTEILLKEGQELFELLVKGSRDAIWDWKDMSKDESYTSPQIAKILGYKEGEVDTCPSEYFKMIHPEDLDYVEQTIEKHLKTATHFEMEYRIKTKSGKYKWVSGKGIAVKNNKTGTKRMVGSLSDIDERKKTELLLKESQELFNLTVKGSRDGIWDWPDMAKDEGYWSPGFKKILGYEDDELEATTALFLSLIHPDDLDFVLKTVEEHIKTRLPFEAEYRVKTKSGKYKWIQARGIASQSKNPGSSRMTGSLTDISVRKEAEEKLAEHAKELERINEDLNSFAYIASHDLKEPIRGIYSNILFLEQDFEGQLLPEVARRLGRMSYLCERMEKLTDDLLNYAKLKNKDLVIKRIDVDKIIRDIINTINKGANSNKIEFNVPKPLPKVICDEITVAELFRNLIHNAIKYNNSDIKKIELGFNKIVDTDDIPKYAFYVKDNGVGIREEDIDKIFHIFKRLDNTEELVHGSGMGLSFVQRIIDRHGGKIWVESKLGEGSIFHFTLS